ncbi:MAG: phosphoribosyl-ATP pyrophosphatase [Paenibacillaceae bacterium]|jgi:phosphoribosyl-ATP pyrophosphohydrolase/phosphoribosyl-AMP cyclohydrolase|nr:phosphoribosyl-ATP pyrophosphatase [Paenibacillaceae bacterium]
MSSETEQKLAATVEELAELIPWSADGLVTAVVQDAVSKDVLMVAYMNREALKLTVESGDAWFWSRSRQELWHKGATSGNVQQVKSLAYDCDADTLLLKVVPQGPACHTGSYSCFYRELPLSGAAAPQSADGAGAGNADGTAAGDRAEGAAWACGPSPAGSETVEGGPAAAAADRGQEEYFGSNVTGVDREAVKGWRKSGTVDAQDRFAILALLESVIAQRELERPEGAYTTFLFDKGVDKILKKVGEEASEVIIAAKNRSPEELRYEVSDLIYHLLVLLREQKLPLDDVLAELDRRHNK